MAIDSNDSVAVESGRGDVTNTTILVLLYNNTTDPFLYSGIFILGPESMFNKPSYEEFTQNAIRNLVAFSLSFLYNCDDWEWDKKKT